MEKRKRRRSDRAGRPAMRSPGRPPVAGRAEQQRFWQAITRGCRVRRPQCPVACRRPWVVVGSGRAVGCRRSAWRPDQLAPCPSRSGKRSRSCARRAPGCATLPVGSGEPRRLSRESCVATRRLGAAVWRIGRRRRSGTVAQRPTCQAPEDSQAGHERSTAALRAGPPRRHGQG